MAIKDTDEHMRERHLKNSTSFFFYVCHEIKEQNEGMKSKRRMHEFGKSNGKRRDIHNHKYLIIIENFIKERVREREVNSERKTKRKKKVKRIESDEQQQRQRQKEPGKKLPLFHLFQVNSAVQLR